MFKSATSRFVFFLILVVLFLGLSAVVPLDQEHIRAFLDRFPLGISGAVFIVLYVTLSFFIWIGPKDVFKILGAALYGPYVSFVLVMLAEMINLVALFSLSRLLGRDFVAARLPGKMQQLDRAVADTGFLSIFFLRFFPIVPFRFLDLGFGLTKISLKKYFIIAFLGSPLRIFLVQLFLALGWETVSRPTRFAEYLLAHPGIFWMSSIYVVGAIFSALILRKKMTAPSSN